MACRRHPCRLWVAWVVEVVALAFRHHRLLAVVGAVEVVGALACPCLHLLVEAVEVVALAFRRHRLLVGVEVAEVEEEAVVGAVEEEVAVEGMDICVCAWVVVEVVEVVEVFRHHHLLAVGVEVEVVEALVCPCLHLLVGVEEVAVLACRLHRLLGVEGVGVVEGAEVVVGVAVFSEEGVVAVVVEEAGAEVWACRRLLVVVEEAVSACLRTA